MHPKSKSSYIGPLPIVEKGGKKYLRLYYYMPAKYLFNLLKDDEIKVSIPEECNDPLEFTSAKLERKDGSKRESKYDGGFISFSERYDISLLWSHYADSHKGVCLRFDFPISQRGLVNASGILRAKTTPPFITIESPKNPEQYYDLGDRHFAILIKVSYQTERPVINGIITGGGFCSGNRIERFDLSPVFYTKATEWSYENEWRLLITPGAVSNFHESAFFVTGLTQFLTGIFLGKQYSQRRAITWAKILHSLKKNENFSNPTDIAERIILGNAEYHDTEYKIIIPQLEQE